MTDLVMDIPDVVCIDCRVDLPIGAAYSQRLVAFAADGIPITNLICLACAEPSHG